MRIKISIVNFWDGAFSNDFLAYYLRLATENKFEIINNHHDADIVFSSVFGNIKTNPEKTIFYTGENIRPDFQKCKYSLSFDLDHWDQRNFYLPLWYSKIAWPGFEFVRKVEKSTHGNEKPVAISTLTSRRNTTEIHKSKFCAFFAGNPEVNRINLLRKITTYKNVDGFGYMFGKPFFDSKNELLKEYKFCLCPENDFYPGYVTEKLFDAYIGGSIPIYFGGLPEDGLINKRAFVNFQTNSDTMLQQIISLDCIETLYDRMFSEPLLLTEPSLNTAIDFLRHCIHSIKPTD